jgi:small-conductance mechanosensitive channel
MQRILDAALAEIGKIASAIPSILQALLILLIGYILAKVLSRLVKRLLITLGADALAEKLNRIELIGKSNIQIRPSAFFSKLVYYIVFIVFLIAAVEALGMQAISAMLSDFIAYLPKAFAALLVLVFGIYLADLVKKAVLGTTRSLGISAAPLIANAVFYFALINIVLIALRQAEMQTSFMEANLTVILAGIVAAFAIGYGLASRDLVANLLSAFYNREKLKIGDEIAVDGVRGTIIELNNNSLTLRTASGSRVIIPMAKLSRKHVEVYDEDFEGDRLAPPNR